MIFLDESGVDKGNNKSNPFFIICLVGVEDYRKENDKLRKFLLHKKDIFKWQKLSKTQKQKFDEYAIRMSYKIDSIYNIKNISNAKYFDLLTSLLNNKAYHKELIIYTGLHLNSIFEKVRKTIKNKSKINIRFRESVNDEEKGIQIADLWAGYINHSIKNNKELKSIKNLNVREYK